MINKGMKGSGKQMILVYSVAWMILVIIHAIIVHFSFGQQLLPAVTEALIFNIWFAILGSGVWYMIRFTGLRTRGWQELLFLHLSGATVVQLLWLLPVYPLLTLLFSSDEMYLSFLNDSLTMRIITGVVLYLILSSLSYLIMNLKQLKEQEVHHAELQNLLKESEINLLRFQINPHFLFNSLNSVSSLIMTRPHEANKMIISLSEFMRYSLNSSGKVMSTLDEEMKHCNDYLAIEKVRFGSGLVTDICMEENTLSYPVPAMMIQPLVENAIKHGMNDNTEGITITINSSIKDGVLRLEVINPFSSNTETKSKGTGTGIKNIRNRLAKIYGRNDLLTISIEENRFHVTINLPYYEK